MHVKKLVIAGVVLSTLLFLNTAHARSGFQNTLNTALGSTFGVNDCFACHVGGFSGATATTAIANTWRAVGADTTLLANTDSDGDGFTNKQEASGKTTNFNTAAATPFTLATGGVRLTNVYVTGDAQATEKAITATASGITVPVGSEILGGVAIDIYANPTSFAPITLLYKAGAAALTSTVYAVDTYSIATDPYATNTTLPLTTTDWSLTPQGGVQLHQLPTGANATYDIVVVRVTPTTTINNNLGDSLSSDSGSNDDDDDNNPLNGISCMANVGTPLMMFMALFALGLLVRRKS